ERQYLARDDASSVKGMIEPEVGCERVVGGRGSDPVFEPVARSKAENADGFDAYILIRGDVENRRIRIIGNCTRQDVRRAALGMRDAGQWNLDRLEAPVEVKIQTSELAGAQLVVDLDDRVDLFAPVPVCLEAHFRFEQFNLRRVLRRFFGLWGSGLTEQCAC